MPGCLLRPVPTPTSPGFHEVKKIILPFPLGSSWGFIPNLTRAPAHFFLSFFFHSVPRSCQLLGIRQTRVSVNLSRKEGHLSRLERALCTRGPNSNLGLASRSPLGLSFLLSSPSSPFQPVPSRIPGILSFLAENNTEAFHKALPPPPLAPLRSTARVPGTRAAPRWSHELRLSLV